ncbi:hypothetical protein GCM10023084_71970 [Streptomyces lacrimifluminis]|uniref:Uncharacterized protein n=1 Tax=Streptomyces lacrimifluminis TaxID=1500077 RepID=A0A917P5P1_9ACTN|nr:hypothetical protein [Streptomyces lacrimifluminis]GGJ62783.1 hypothetical protein GCM10012282_70050 [Streptomyces lacrimifluminis]
MAERLGAGHLMLGTDHPFLRAPLETALATVSEAADRNILSGRQIAGVLGLHALRFLGP